MGSDPQTGKDAGDHFKISIHAPRMGSDAVQRHACHHVRQFQSTLPGWGATYTRLRYEAIWAFQSTLPGWGATVTGARQTAARALFQSTLPGWGATAPEPQQIGDEQYFNPRSPDGERLQVALQVRAVRVISIHAPRMGSDLVARSAFVKFPVISIHAPRMGSDVVIASIQFGGDVFQSTLPGWGATAKMDIFAHDMGKIIHFQH